MVIISNGHNKFHLAPLAAEMAHRRCLSLFITGAYPGRVAKRLLGHPALRSAALQRYLSREEPEIPSKLVKAENLSEWVLQLGRLASRMGTVGRNSIAMQLEVMALRAYARGAARAVRNANAQIYHYRAGYGLGSVLIARRKGMVTVCDHSIANPEVIDYLIKNNGNFPRARIEVKLSDFWEMVRADIRAADYVVVNSDFVKETFVRLGWPSKKIFVQYWGTDDAFMRSVPTRVAPPGKVRPKLLFAGAFCRRKGAEAIFGALDLLGDTDFDFDVVGPVEPEFAPKGHPRLLFRGVLSRAELARAMAAADIFVFPSLAEGSARVVFEAMAAGCFIITTPNTGSIVQSGAHGVLVPPGSAHELAMAIRGAVANIEHCREKGQQNAALVATKYNQKAYGDGVFKLYNQFIAAAAISCGAEGSIHPQSS